MRLGPNYVEGPEHLAAGGEGGDDCAPETDRVQPSRDLGGVAARVIDVQQRASAAGPAEVHHAVAEAGHLQSLNQATALVCVKDSWNSPAEVEALTGLSLFAVLPGTVVALVAIGGVTYTAGVVFHLWSRLPFHNTIWHVFVLTATFTMYAGVVVALVA